MKKKKKRTHPWGEIVTKNLSVSKSLTSSRKDKVKHYIGWKTHNPIALMFWVKSGVKCLICVRLMSYRYNHNLSMTKTHMMKYKSNSVNSSFFVVFIVFAHHLLRDHIVWLFFYNDHHCWTQFSFKHYTPRFALKFYIMICLIYFLLYVSW